MIICSSGCINIKALQTFLVCTDIISYKQRSLRTDFIQCVTQLCNGFHVLFWIQSGLDLFDQSIDLRKVQSGLIGSIHGHGVVNTLGIGQ